MRKSAAAALKHGLESKATLMEVPPNVSGVGEGIQVCHWQCRVPVAIPTADGEAVAFDLETPCVSGRGKHLPVILGLKKKLCYFRGGTICKMWHIQVVEFLATFAFLFASS